MILRPLDERDTPGGSRRRFPALGTALLLVAASAGCSNVIYRGPVVRVGEERRAEKTLEEGVAVRFDLDRAALSPDLTVRPVRLRRLRLEQRGLYREYGTYFPYDPLVKTVELLSSPAVFLFGAVLVYSYWTSTTKDGGVGEGDAKDMPGEAVGLEDLNAESREAVLDQVVRDPSIESMFRRNDFPFLDWWLLLSEAADPFATGRTWFPARRCFGAVGPVLEGPWKSAERTDESPEEGAGLTVRLGEEAVQGEPAGNGSIRIGLLDLGSGPLSFAAEAKTRAGPPASGRFEVDAAYLEAVQQARALREAIAKDPKDFASRLRLAGLHAGTGGLPRALAAIEAALAAGAPPSECAQAERAAFRAAARLAFDGGDPVRAFFLDALADFAPDVVDGASATWDEAVRTPERTLTQGLGSESPVERARAAILTAGLAEPPASTRTAALLALLRTERVPIAVYAILWVLERCGTEDAAVVLKLSGSWSDDPLLAYRAGCAVRAIEARPTE